MRSPLLRALLPLALLATSAAAAQDARSVACTFRSGWTYTYAKGVYTPERAKPLALEVVDIDLEAQTAALATAKGKGRLTVVRALGANHYIEAVTEGFLNVTTIYDLDPRLRAHPAVHSRHVGLLGQPVVAQYHGFCKPR